MKTQKIIISCGGTGGHIFPALEIAKSLQKKDSNLDILFVGASHRMEMQKVPKAGFPIKGLWIQGIYRKSIIKNILFPLKFIISLIQSFFILLKHKPVAVIGTGGFASFPILYTASWFRINTYIQEQNCYPGLANRRLAKHVKRIFVAHDGMKIFFPENKILNFGNPVRKSLKLSSISKKDSRDFFGLKENTFTILILGGSLGAPPINKLVQDLFFLPNLFSEPFQFIWQTGESHNENDFKNFSNCFKTKFIDRMDLAYHAADIVVSRAGAIAIAELCFLSKPSILIPSPHVTANHQTINANYLKKNTAAFLISEKEIKNQKPDSYFTNLIDFIESLIQDENKREEIGKNANQLFKYDAADEISSIVLADFNFNNYV
jgi:UDP-N-acetylglucosamine--N-acetylmuramyl-(pentapeptide) pyrophosphoryl-undecaprenol N-acetylglucosamine transferase